VITAGGGPDRHLTTASTYRIVSLLSLIVGYLRNMAEPPPELSAAALRLAGHVGQTALDRIADGGLAAVAQLDQHVAAVRAELTICQRPPGTDAQEAGQRVILETGRRARTRRGIRIARGSRTARGTRSSRAGDLQTRLAMLRNATVRCPDVPFVGDALHAEAIVPVTLLLHYASGFVEAGVNSGWWPAESADATDWVSLRLAAICQLISQAEEAADVHPDLRASAKQD
jgi:hypothetical protein